MKDNRNKNRFNDDRYKSCTLSIRAISKTTAGGRKRRMAVLIATYDKKTKSLGLGKGKAISLFSAIEKAEYKSKKYMTRVKSSKGTILHDVSASYGNIDLLMRKNKPGNGLIAGGSARKILELAGINSICCKYNGRSNVYNMSYAVMKCLKNIETVSEIANRTGKTVKDIIARRIR